MAEVPTGEYAFEKVYGWVFVKTGYERVVTHYVDQSIYRNVTRCWTAANPGPFGAVGCFTWKAWVTDKVPVYGWQDKYETLWRQTGWKRVPVTEPKTVTTTTHDDHACATGQAPPLPNIFITGQADGNRRLTPPAGGRLP